jgi:hypothetical protein
MKKRSTKTSREPSKASLREIPEVTLDRYHVVGRGTRVELARESFESVVLDRKTVEVLGGADGIRVAQTSSGNGASKSSGTTN